MALEKLVLNAVLNNAVRARKAGNTDAEVVKVGCGFFAGDQIAQAKRLIWSEAKMSVRLTDTQKVSDTFTDILKALNYSDKNSVPLPKFVIFQPDEIAAVPGESIVTLTRKVNELHLEFKSFVSSFDQPSSSTSTPGTKDIAKVGAKPSYAVVLNIPKALDNPDARKRFVDSLCPNSDEINQLRKTKDDWKLIVRSKSSARTIVENLKSNAPDVTAKLKVRLFIAVLMRAPTSITEQDIKRLVPNATKVAEIGSYERAKVFKMYFDSKNYVVQFLSDSIRIGYEKLPAQQFKFMPKRCYSCHCVGHIAADCSQSRRCGRCGAEDHNSSKDLPCKSDMFCVLRNKNGQTCYSVRCPANNSPSK